MKPDFHQLIVFSGAGGQGIMVMAKVLAEAAMREGRELTYLPSYGAEVRGGSARCMLTISSKRIGSPFIEQADSLIVMNQASLEKYAGMLKPSGTLVVNTSLASLKQPLKTIKPVNIAATEIALGLGNPRVANIVALGALIGVRQIVSPQTVKDVLFEMAARINSDLFEINKKAFEKGLALYKA